MNKTKLEVIRINEDVIATSGEVIEHEQSKYHLILSSLMHESPDSFKVFDENYQQITDLSKLPSEIKEKAVSIDYSKSLYYINLSEDINTEFLFYWNGKDWANCTSIQHY